MKTERQSEITKWLSKAQKDMLYGDDGYLFYWPEGCNGGFQAHHLREIADYLDYRNFDWDRRVKEDLSNSDG